MKKASGVVGSGFNGRMVRKPGRLLQKMLRSKTVAVTRRNYKLTGTLAPIPWRYFRAELVAFELLIREHRALPECRKLYAQSGVIRGGAGTSGLRPPRFELRKAVARAYALLDQDARALRDPVS